MNDRPPGDDVERPGLGSGSAGRVRDLFILVSGYLVGIAGFYTNFLPTLLAATALLVNILGVVWLGSLFLWWITRLRRWKSAGLPEPQKPKISAVSVLSVVFCLVLMFTVTWMAFRPPGVQHQPSAEACVYDVRGGVSVPVISGGSIIQEFVASADRIHAISVIIGLDPTLADLNKAHPVHLRVQSEEEGVDQILTADDIVNNGFTRVNFREPLHIKNRNSIFSIRVINKSDEPVGIYIKIPDVADTIRTEGEGVFIEGHLGQEAPYRFPDHALSACVAGRAS